MNSFEINDNSSSIHINRDISNSFNQTDIELIYSSGDKSNSTANIKKPKEDLTYLEKYKEIREIEKHQMLEDVFDSIDKLDSGILNNIKVDSKFMSNSLKLHNAQHHLIKSKQQNTITDNKRRYLFKQKLYEKTKQDK